MRSLKDYIKLIPAGFANADKIVEGIYNNVIHDSLPEDQQEEIIRRRVICAGCPFMSGNNPNPKGGDHCTLCGCPIKTKTASLHAECGAASYNKQHPNSPLPIRWEKYESSKN